MHIDQFPTPRFRGALGAVAGLFLLAACGGGGGGDAVSDTTGTADDTALAFDEGAIQGFGSVIVNGTHYASGDAEILVDGQPASEDDLKLGMVVRVEVDSGGLGRDQAPARRILFHSALQGAIESIDAGAESLVVLGFTIATDELTRIYDAAGQAATLADLSPGDRVRVSGFRRAAGGLTATFIHADDDGDSQLVRGRISDLDRDRLRFKLYGLNVDYSAAGVIETRDRLENGDFVEVEGQMKGNRESFDAERVTELRDRPGPGDQDRPSHGSVQGTVNAVDGATSCPELAFSVDGQAVQVNADTQYRNGGCADIEVDRRLVAVGRFADDGTLIAAGVGFPPRINGLVRAQVEEIHRVSTTTDGNGPRCTLRVLEDLFVIVNDHTHQGSSSSGDGTRGYSCRDVTVGQYVFALGHFEETAERDLLTARFLAPADGPRTQDTHPSGEYSAVAGEVQRIDPLSRQFEVLGTLVQTDQETDFRDSSEAEFYATTQAGDFAGALGPWTGSVIDAAMAGRFDAEDMSFGCSGCDGTIAGSF